MGPDSARLRSGAHHEIELFLRNTKVVSRRPLWCTAKILHLVVLTQGITLEVRPESVVEFCPAGPVSEKILEVAEKLRVDLIIMGLRRSTYVDTASHMPWATAYEVVRTAGCPVLTFRK